jgi:hypothetical protein
MTQTVKIAEQAHSPDQKGRCSFPQVSLTPEHSFFALIQQRDEKALSCIRFGCNGVTSSSIDNLGKDFCLLPILSVMIYWNMLTLEDLYQGHKNDGVFLYNTQFGGGGYRSGELLVI